MSAKPLSKTQEFLEDLKSDEVKRRVAAVKHLHLIAEAFGPQKTADTLLPFLREYENDDEEVLIELAKQFEQLGLRLGPSLDNIAVVLPYYAIVLSYEDVSVLDEGMGSLRRLVTRFGLKHEALAVLGKELIANGTPKALVSAIRVFSELHEYIAPKHNDTIRKLIEDNISSSYCIVRKETAVALRRLLAADGERCQIALHGLKVLFGDAQDTVKLHALESLCNQKFTSAMVAVVAPLVLDPCVKRSWRLRYVVAAHVLKLLESNVARPQLVDFYVALLLDGELEVATKAIESLKTSFRSLTSDDILEKVMPAFKAIALSDNADIKAAVAGSVLYLAPAIGKTHSNEHIKEILVGLLKDESSEIRVALLNNHEPLAAVMSLSSLVNILNPVLKELLADKDWKIREQGVRALEKYLIKLGEVYCSSDSVLDDLKANLRDRVYAVRQAALGMLYGLSEKFGQKWTEKYALTVLSSFTKNSNYLMRLNYIFGLRLIAHIINPQVLKDEAETVAKLCKDKVANVRFQAILDLLMFYNSTQDAGIEKLVVGVARELEKDEDSDVQSLIGPIVTSNDVKGVVKRMLAERG